MATKDIKVGNFYHVLVKVLGIDPKNGEIATETANEFGTSLNMEPTYFARGEKEAFFPIITENDRKNSEPAPKYDPCRKFRKGDMVRVVERNGRNGTTSPSFTGTLLTVAFNELTAEWLCLFDHEKNKFYIDPAYIELVTPVDEIEPYFVKIGGFNDEWHLWRIDNPNEKTLIATFNKSHPNAKAAAEAECARLNAEHRKELSHD